MGSFSDCVFGEREDCLSGVVRVAKKLLSVD